MSGKWTLRSVELKPREPRPYFNPKVTMFCGSCSSFNEFVMWILDLTYTEVAVVEISNNICLYLCIYFFLKSD